jgi:hypothetical protein
MLGLLKVSSKERTKTAKLQALQNRKDGYSRD